MPKRSRTPREDVTQLAARLVRDSTGQQPAPVIPLRPKRKRKNPAAVALGRLGGLKGGKARAASLPPRRRSEIAREAARRRWSKKQPEGQS
jgi:hypothetical protein